MLDLFQPRAVTLPGATRTVRLADIVGKTEALLAADPPPPR